MNNIRQEVLSRIAGKYSSTLQNFHQRELSQILAEEPCPLFFVFEDLMDYSEEQEFMKRYYKKQESKKKKILFGQYYSMLINKPRIVNKDLQQVYQKWHYKKRKLVFRDLYQESKTIVNSSESESRTNQPTQVSCFLYNISTYNPVSQNYYLKTQTKQKQKMKLKQKNDDREGRSIESILDHLLDNSYGKKITQISFTKKKKHNRYHSIDNLLNLRKSQNAMRTTKKTSKILLTERKSENLLSHKNIKNMRVLNLKNHKVKQQNPQKQKTSDRIVKTLSSTNFFSIQSSQKLPKKTIFMSNQLKPLEAEFSDKKFQTVKMPRLIQNVNKDQKFQKANKILSLKLKC